MNSVVVTANRWKLGWELELDRGGVTQVRTLARAVQQVRDYLDTVEPEIDHADYQIDIIPEIGPVGEQVRQAKAASENAAAVTIAAARQMRQAVSELKVLGLSTADIACVLGVSKGRASQLLAEAA